MMPVAFYSKADLPKKFELEVCRLKFLLCSVSQRLREGL